MTTYTTTITKKAEAIRILLHAAEHLQQNNWPFNFNTLRAINLLNEKAVEVLASHIYMHHGKRIDRDANTGKLGLFSESNYHTTQDGNLIRLHA